MFVTFITPASWLRRLKVYQWGQHIHGTRDSITGPLVLAGIAHRAGHHVEAYEELNGSFDMDRLVRANGHGRRPGNARPAGGGALELGAHRHRIAEPGDARRG